MKRLPRKLLGCVCFEAREISNATWLKRFSSRRTNAEGVPLSKQELLLQSASHHSTAAANTNWHAEHHPPYTTAATRTFVISLDTKHRSLKNANFCILYEGSVIVTGRKGKPQGHQTASSEAVAPRHHQSIKAAYRRCLDQARRCI